MIRDPRQLPFRPSRGPANDAEVLAYRIELAKEVLVQCGERFEAWVCSSFVAVRRALRTLPDRRAIRVFWNALRAKYGRKPGDVVSAVTVAACWVIVTVWILRWVATR